MGFLVARRDASLVAVGAVAALALPIVARRAKALWARVSEGLRRGGRRAGGGPRVAVLVGPAQRYAAGLEAAVGSEWRLRKAANSADGLREACTQAGAVDAVVVSPASAGFLGEAAASLAGVALVQALSAGYEFIPMEALAPGTTVCNTSSMDVPISEYVVLAALEARVRARAMDARMRASDGGWQPPFYEARPAESAYRHGELCGASVCLVGAGGIGTAVAARLQPFGCDVRVARSRTTADELDAMVAAADVVVVACACNEKTVGLFDARRLGLAKATATLINVSRGKVCDERALFEALAEGRLAHAVLDVWWRYPDKPGATCDSPGDLPWRDLGPEKLTMTPHASGWSDKQDARKCAQIAANLDLLARGEPLARVVGP